MTIDGRILDAIKKVGTDSFIKGHDVSFSDGFHEIVNYKKSISVFVMYPHILRVEVIENRKATYLDTKCTRNMTVSDIVDRLNASLNIARA